MKSLDNAGNPGRMSVNQVLSILVESGFIYCLLWLMQIMDLFNVSRDNAVIYLYFFTDGAPDADHQLRQHPAVRGTQQRRGIYGSAA